MGRRGNRTRRVKGCESAVDGSQEAVRTGRVVELARDHARVVNTKGVYAFRPGREEGGEGAVGRAEEGMSSIGILVTANDRAD